MKNQNLVLFLTLLLAFDLSALSYKIKNQPQELIIEEGKDYEKTNCQSWEYAYKNKCFKSCRLAAESPLFADNSNMTCQLTRKSSNFFQLYSLSSCINSCGSSFEDCSCKADCVHEGNCCFDYEICDSSESIPHHSLSNCEYSHNGKLGSSTPRCLTCKQSYFLYNGKCVKECPENYFPSKYNRLCLLNNPNQSCSSNCQICSPLDENSFKCKRCELRFFSFKNICLETCPEGYIADKSIFECVNAEKSIEQINYSVYPSTASCFNNCGKFPKLSNCSCESTCKRSGTCCSDFADTCNIISENKSIYHHFEFYTDKKKELDKEIQEQKETPDPTPEINVASQNENQKTNKIIDSAPITITTGYSSTSNQNSGITSILSPNSNIQGNLTLRVYKNNQGMKIKNTYINNLNSHNKGVISMHKNNSSNSILNDSLQSNGVMHESEESGLEDFS